MDEPQYKVKRHVPGPWFHAPWWKKCWLWLRYRLPHLVVVTTYSTPRYLWTYYITYRHAWVNKGFKFPRPVSGHNVMLPPPGHIIPLFWRADPHEMGRYYTVEYEEVTPSLKTGDAGDEPSSPSQ